jgi:crotonobetainyl-CoA:carnitine CoA-transferase CaiB-like acyl-CoA transferase
MNIKEALNTSASSRGTLDSGRSPPQPLAGLRVVEFTHRVIGPTCGRVLADRGAEVIKVEPIADSR